MPRSMQIFTLLWDNIDQRMVAAHKRVMSALGLRVVYSRVTMPHGRWMDAIMERAQVDVVGFLDIDCVPVNPAIITSSVDFAYNNTTFIGIAQASNDIPLRTHIFAAPAFYFISKRAWERMGKPSFRATPRSDVAEGVSYRAEELGIRYRALYPTHFEREPVEGVWRLHNYGLFGIGRLSNSFLNRRP